MPGSHGSLTKAGKVRGNTPKGEKKEKAHNPKGTPRGRLRHQFHKMLLDRQNQESSKFPKKKSIK